MIQKHLCSSFCKPDFFENVWNKDFIDNVQITFAGRLGVEERGGYYDQSGALRDMVQNHTFTASIPTCYG